MESKISKKDIKVRQHDRKDCAAACLASVCAHYGLKLPMITFRDACGTSEDGATIQGIIDAGRKFGMDAVGLKSPDKKLSDLQNGRKPIILHLEKNNGWLHFVVLYGLDSKTATIMDPETGDIQKYKTEEIEKQWSGYIVALTPSPLFIKGDRRTRIFERYRDLLVCHKKELFLVLLGSMTVIAATLSTSVFLQRIIDHILPQKDTQSLIYIALVMAVLTLMIWGISIARSALLLKSSLKIDYSLIMQYFRKLFRLPVSFFDSRSSGELHSRVSDAYRIRSFITSRLLVIIASILTLILSIIILSTFYWKLTVVITLFIPIYILLYTLSRKQYKKLNKEIIEANAKFEETSIENIASARAIMYFSAGEDAAQRIQSDHAIAARSMYKGGMFSSFIASSADCIGRITTVVVLIAGSYLVLNSTMSIGELASFFTISSLFSSPIALLIESTKEITEARISAERMFDIIDMDETENTDVQHQEDVILDGDEPIHIRSLSFSFPGRKALMENMSFDILPHKINLIRGSNGSGKSTFAAMLMRGYKPDSGFISLGEKDIYTIPLDRWRRFVSIIPQRPDIFNATILENIIMGDKDYSMESVMAACALAGLEKTLGAIPSGVMAHTGEHACRLSGGEKQKIAIARALYRKAKIIIMDEASSHLDADGQKSIQETILTMKDNGITIVLISHDERAALTADHIIDFEKPNAQTEA